MIEKLKLLKQKKHFKKIILALVCIIAIQGTYYLTTAEKNKFSSITAEQRGTYDRALMRAGTPKELLGFLPDYQKKFILEHLEQGAVYNTSNSYIAEAAGIDAESMPDMRFSLISYSFEVDGEQQYQLFPSFQWLGNGYTIENDVFSFTLEPEWEGTSIWKEGEDSPVEMAVYFTRSNGKQISIDTVNPYDIYVTEAGYCFQMPKGCNKKSDGCYGACAVCCVKKKTESATPFLHINYKHYTNSFLDSHLKGYLCDLKIEE